MILRYPSVMKRRLPAHSADPARPDLHLRWARLSAGRPLALSRVWFHPGDRYPLHTHDYPEVFWLESGSLVHRSAGGERTVVPGTVVLMHPDCAHGIDADAGGDAVVANVAIAWDDLRRLQAQWPQAPAWGGPSAPRYVALPPAGRARLSEWFAAIHGQGASAFDRDAFVLLLWSLFERAAADAQRGPAWLREAVAALASPHRLALGLPALAEEAGRSREHVSRAVRAAYGCTARELLMRMRVEAVARGLRDGTRPLRELAGEVGVSSLGHFAAAFARRYGCRPGEYRRAR